MTAGVIALALASAVRPTSAAAVYALLASSEPRRLLSAYIMAGFAASAAFGVLVVAILHTRVTLATSPHALIDLLLGVAALAFAAGAARGAWAGRSQAKHSDSTVVRRLRHPSLGVAATAGIVTHLPGLFYLAALADILASQLGFLEAVLDVLIYNLIWFGAAIAALACFIARPQETRARIAALNDWARQHERAIVVLVFAAVGVYLVLKALTSILE